MPEVQLVTVPENGSTLQGFVGDQNLTVFCGLSEHEDRFEVQQITEWFIRKDHESSFQMITGDTPGFVITGDPFPGGDFNDLTFGTNLTILSLTIDLDNAEILCGIEYIPDVASFFIRVEELDGELNTCIYLLHYK